MTDERPTHPDGPAPPRASRIGADFQTRLVSALVLLAIVLAGVIASPVTFAALVLVVTGLVAWEWSRMVRGAEYDLPLFIHIAATIVAGLLAASGWPALGVVAIAIGAGLVGMLSWDHNGRQSGIGVLYSGLPAVAMIWFRGAIPNGLDAILYLLFVVIATDTGAYFAGRLIGGPKLWPRVSPNKTWSGLGGAVVAAAVVGALFALWLPAPVTRLALMGAVLAVIAQAGDLFESALKRKYGTKDASALIPGHGGFMDRVDGLVAAVVAAALLALMVNAMMPARALLFGL
jgi:phosphatidate cytidylyltransferase